MYIDYIFFCWGYGMNKKIKEMVESGFENEKFLMELNNDDLVMI